MQKHYKIPDLKRYITPAVICLLVIVGSAWGVNYLKTNGVIAPTVGPSVSQQHIIPAVSSSTVVLGSSPSLAGPWWSPTQSVAAAAVAVTTYAVAGYTVGPAIIFTRPGRVMGVQCYTGLSGTHTMTMRLYDSTAASVKNIDVVMSGPGLAIGIFSTPYTIDSSNIYRGAGGGGTYFATGYSTAGYSYITLAAWTGIAGPKPGTGANGIAQFYPGPAWYMFGNYYSTTPADAVPASLDTVNLFPCEPIFTF